MRVAPLRKSEKIQTFMPGSPGSPGSPALPFSPCWQNRGGRADSAGSPSWRRTSWLQTLFPFPRRFYFRHTQGILQQYLLRIVNVFACPFDYLCTSLPFLTKGRREGRGPGSHCARSLSLCSATPFSQSFSTGSPHATHPEKFLPRANLIWRLGLSPCPAKSSALVTEPGHCWSPSPISRLLITLRITPLAEISQQTFPRLSQGAFLVPVP